MPPSPGGAAAVAAALARHQAGHGITGIYTATAGNFAVISATTGLTVWTDGRLLWPGHGGQRRTWPADGISAAVAAIGALAGPGIQLRKLVITRRLPMCLLQTRSAGAASPAVSRLVVAA